MADGVYYAGQHDRVWEGFSREQALAWTRVLRVHWPDWPGAAIMWMLSNALKEGVPAALETWADRARRAEAVGFSPELYDRMQRALDEIPAVEHPTHPDNDPDPRWPIHTIRPFAAATWQDWPWLVEQGWTDQEAVTLLLTADELVGGRA